MTSIVTVTDLHLELTGIVQFMMNSWNLYSESITLEEKSGLE
jgi:hypothetical protein